MTDLFGNEEPAKTAKPMVYKNLITENPDLVPAQTAQSMDYDFTKIRKTFHNGQWYFAYLDVIAILTDSTNPKVYAAQLKRRLNAEGSKVFTNCKPLKFIAPDSKLRSTQCLSREDTFRLIEEIPSPKAEPFKQWIAHLAHERLEEIKNPSKGIDNAVARWKEMGKSEEWIAWRLKGKISRRSETDTLKAHGITKSVDFAHFTDRTNKAVYGATAEKVKEDRGLAKTDSLRDNSSALELRFLDLHELGCTVGIEQRKAFGRSQIDGVYDVVGGIVENTKQAFIDAFGAKAVTAQSVELPSASC